MSEKYGFRKPTRKNKRTHVVSLKPIQHVPGEFEGEDKVFACFVDSRGSEHRVPATLLVARRIDGGRSNNPKVNKSLDSKLDRDFFVHLGEIAGVETVVSVDSFPKQVGGRIGTREDTDEGDDIVLIINASTGDIDVVSMPPRIAVAQLLRILGGLDQLDIVSVDDELPGEYRVADVSGNKIRLELK